MTRLPSGRFALGLDLVVFIDSIGKLEIKLQRRNYISVGILVRKLTIDSNTCRVVFEP